MKKKLKSSQTKRLEIIHIRLFDDLPSKIIGEIQRSISQVSNKTNLIIYRHATISNDIGLHLHIESKVDNPDIGQLGIRLAAALKEYGEVNHSIWFREINDTSLLNENSNNIKTK